MNIEFEKWLKKKDLFEYYTSHPEQQQSIYEAYQRESEIIEPENIDEFVEWFCNYPELAEERYSKLMGGLTEGINQQEPFIIANIIHKLPEHFNKWKNEVEECFGLRKKRKLETLISMCRHTLEKEYKEKIIEKAVENVRPELIEQKKYWEDQLNNLQLLNMKNAEIVKTENKAVKTFPEYLLHENRELLAEKLKAEFKTEMGKGIRLMIEVLQSYEPQLLNVENRQRAEVFAAMESYFDWYIGTYNSIFSSYEYEKNKIRDKPDFEAVKQKVDFILKCISKKG